ncbi:hypothetical protein L596_000952 [Steinernema carpocapsae]|uniref:Uncharacterized protein n=1 Tax=Steinernema carpocapsae TaxID=34508 RepID=A0A4U8UJW8_STECR|nr:hypothetical protein L596_000952 [Steinernema carpocapsae]
MLDNSGITPSLLEKTGASSSSENETLREANERLREEMTNVNGRLDNVEKLIEAIVRSAPAPKPGSPATAYALPQVQKPVVSGTRAQQPIPEHIKVQMRRRIAELEKNLNDVQTKIDTLKAKEQRNQNKAEAPVAPIRKIKKLVVPRPPEPPTPEPTDVERATNNMVSQINVMTKIIEDRIAFCHKYVSEQHFTI